MTREEVRYFFVKRPFLQPLDLDLIKACETTQRRHEQLVWFARGYLEAKYSFSIGMSPKKSPWCEDE